MKIVQKLKEFGPGLLITAAFIGPGTITTCSLAGAGFGYALLWGLSFSVLATMVLQEMVVRLGLAAQMGLGEALRSQFNQKLAQVLVIVLVVSAIFIGNAAYETGNVLGAALGLEGITGLQYVFLAGIKIRIWGPVIGIAALILLELGSYRKLERFIMMLVFLMALAFISTAVVAGPNLIAMMKGLFVPAMPKGSLVFLVGLIGTTVVPYNLFLHSSAVQERWQGAGDIPKARTDLVLSVLLGGIISMSVVVTGAIAFYGTGQSIQGAADLSLQLKPVLGNMSGVLMAVGLLAAGVSSAITAPLAAAYATSGVLGWPVSMSSKLFKWVWRIILILGIVFSTFGYKPIEAIVFAQFANGLLLPLLAIFLLIVMNNKRLLGGFTNNVWQNLGAVVVVMITLLLSIKSLWSVIEKLS